MEILHTKTNVSLDSKDMDILANGLLEGMIKFGIDGIMKNENLRLSEYISEHKKYDIILLNELSTALGKMSFSTEDKVIKYVAEQSHDFLRIISSLRDNTMIVAPKTNNDFCIQTPNIMKGVKIENYTPHEVRIFESERLGGKQLHFFPKNDNPARVNFNNKVDGYINDSPVNNINSLEIKGLPPKKENTLYIVSFFVLYVLAGKRDDVISPDSSQLVKDRATGTVIGSKGFIRFDNK